MLVMIDDQKVAPEEAVVSVFDLGFSRGLTVFELLRTYQGEPCFLEEHVERLISSAHGMGLDLNASKFDMIDRIESLLEEREEEESMIKIIATAQKSTHRVLPQGYAKLFIIVSDLDIINPALYENGIALKSIDIQRMNPRIKSTYYAPAIRAMKASNEFDDILYTMPDRLICESSTSNIFFVRNNTLFTPKNHILKGITRQAILEHVPHQYSTQECEIYLDEIGEYDEAFLTSSIKEIIPISRIDDVEFTSTLPNSSTRKLLEAYRNLFTHSEQTLPLPS